MSDVDRLQGGRNGCVGAERSLLRRAGDLAAADARSAAQRSGGARRRALDPINSYYSTCVCACVCVRRAEVYLGTPEGIFGRTAGGCGRAVFWGPAEGVRRPRRGGDCAGGRGG